MAIDRKPVRYAHSDGHTDVCYSEDGSKLLTCGSDGDLRIFNGFDDDDPVQSCVGDWNLCIRQKGNNIFVATDNNDIQILTYPDADRNGVLVRFTAHVNHIAVGKNDYIATASEDMEIKILKMSGNQNEITCTFTELKGPPLGVALCPKAKLLAVSCGDGNLYVWELQTRILMKTFDVVPKANSFMNAKLLCRIDFDPLEGKMLAFPKNNTIVILYTSDWSEKFILTTSDVNSFYSIVQFSPCGRFLAASSLTGDIVVWEVFSQNLVGVSRHSKPIALCALAWNPLGNGELAFCDVEGQLGVALNCTQLVDTREDIPLSKNEEQTDVDFSEFQFEDNEAEDDDENTISINKLKNEIMGPADSEQQSIKSTSRASSPSFRAPVIPLQAPFMPSSTPEHFCPRYFCWNEVGIMQGFGSEDLGEKKTIEVEFHDKTFHNSITMPNFQDYTMGSLSTSAVCVANSSQISVVLLNSGSNEWSQSVSDPEEIICCACSDRLVCYATNTYMIRVSTVFGTQKAVLRAPGPVICLAAKAYTVMVAYHSGAVRQNDMCLGIMLLDFSGLVPSSRDLKCPLSPESTLQWMGLTDFLTPAVYDSYGIVTLCLKDSNIWVPFCDTTKQVTNACDGFFITGVFEASQTVRGIRCKGSAFPGFIPTPVQSEIRLEAVFTELDTEKTQLEASLFTWASLNVENVERKYKANAMKLFSLACQNNLDLRAFELMSMLNNPHLVTLGLKYATTVDKKRLAEKLINFASELQRSDSQTTIIKEHEETTVTTPTNVIKPMHLLSSKYKLKQKMKRITQEMKVSQQDKEITKSSENTPSQDLNDSTTSNQTLNDDSTVINTQESLFSNDEPPRNPFLKSLKKNNANRSSNSNDNEENKKEKENDNTLSNKTSEKRKKPELDSSREENEKPKDKQRKLDFFRFSKT